MRIPAALLLLPLMAASAFAQSTSVELSAPVPNLDGLTYFDLARSVVPDLAQVDGRYEGSIPTPVRNLAYPDEPAANLGVSTYGGSALSFFTDDGPRIALMLDAQNPEGGAWSSVLAIFDPAAPGRPIDVADVATDQMTSFAETALLRLGPNDEGLVVDNTHFNSNQGYRDTAVIAMVNGALVQVASVFTFNENYCGMRREQLPHLSPVTTDGDEHWSHFSITVTETTIATQCDGGEKATPGTRAVAATFSWAADSGRYEPDSTALDDLYTQTEARF
jgi:hypothetical protein